MFIRNALKKCGIGHFIYLLKRTNKSDNFDLSYAERIIDKQKALEVCIWTDKEYKNEDSNYDLSVIIPVYNSEKYIDRCLQSVCNQICKYTYQIIIVNDGSKDKSNEIIQKYLKKFTNIRYVEQQNSGVAAARNRGMEDIQSKYVMFIDSDDFIPYNAIELLMEKAYEKEADIVEGSYSNKQGIKMKGKYHEDCDNANAFCDLQGYPWGKVFKTSLFNNIKFPDGCEYEDMIIQKMIFPRATRIVTISNIVYTYQSNRAGLSAQLRKSNKAIYTHLITVEILKSIMEGKIIKSQGLYECLLKQIKLNGERIMHLDNKTQRSAFIISAYYMDQCFCEYSSRTSMGKEMEIIIKNKYFQRYKEFCKWF